MLGLLMRGNNIVGGNVVTAVCGNFLTSDEVGDFVEIGVEVVVRGGGDETIAEGLAVIMSGIELSRGTRIFDRVVSNMEGRKGLGRLAGRMYQQWCGLATATSSELESFAISSLLKNGESVAVVAEAISASKALASRVLTSDTVRSIIKNTSNTNLLVNTYLPILAGNLTPTNVDFELVLKLVGRLVGGCGGGGGKNAVNVALFLGESGKQCSSSFYEGGNVAMQKRMNEVIIAVYTKLFEIALKEDGEEWGNTASSMISFKNFITNYADNGAVASALPKELRGKFQNLLQGKFS